MRKQVQSFLPSINKIKMTNAISISALLIGSIILMSGIAKAQSSNNKDLSLVGNIVPTLIDNPDYPSRASAIVQKALGDYNVTVTATTQAWSGSGLRNGTYSGFIDHYSLNNKRNNYLYSDVYLTIPLHIASTESRATDVTRLDKIYRTSVGVENRFANTDKFRSERSVRWARSPDFLGNIGQLGGQRVDFILADKFMLDEFNKQLSNANEEMMYISKTPIYTVNLHLAMRSDVPNAQAVIDAFNKGLQSLKDSGEYAGLIAPSDDAASLLDEALYQEIVRKW